MQTVHATTVALDGTGVLLRGPAGSGKSDLALRLIDQGARLVADDRTALALEGGRIIARAPETIAGRTEVRGLEIGRASGRARVCQYVSIPVVAVSLKNKTKNHTRRLE